MATFQVKPQTLLGVAKVKGTHGLIRTLKETDVSAFKKAVSSQRRGVYVFGLRSQKGAVRPWYVGLAKKQTFAEEAMTHDKLRKYAAAMFGRTGRPTITLVAAPLTGPGNSIDDLETLLIWIARERNPKLLNEKKVSSSPKKLIGLVNKLEIVGVLNSGKGKPSNAAKDFSKLMGL
jgi:hypothetical protein